MSNEKVVKKIVEQVFKIENSKIHLKSINNSLEKSMVTDIIDIIINNTKG